MPRMNFDRLSTRQKLVSIAAGAALFFPMGVKAAEGPAKNVDRELNGQTTEQSSPQIEATPNQEQDTFQVVINANPALRIREGAGTKFASVGAVKDGTVVTVYETTANGDWYRIGTDQWISAKFTQPVSDETTEVVESASFDLPRTPEQAAEKYGASALTRNANNWEVTEYDNGEVVGSNYLPDDEGRHTRVEVGPGVISEGYLDVPQLPADSRSVPFFENKDFRAIPFVFNGTDSAWAKYMDMMGTTNFQFKTQDAQAGRLHAHWNEFFAKEGKEQPGAIRLPINFAPECPPEFDVAKELGLEWTAEKAAAKFGADAYSKNPANWTVTSFDGGKTMALTLRFDEDEFRTTRIQNLEGVMVEGWIGVRGDNSAEVPFFQGKELAITLVADGRVTDELDVRGATLWVKAVGDLGDNLNILFDQMTKREAAEQPGALVLPVGWEPDSEVCPAQ